LAKCVSTTRGHPTKVRDLKCNNTRKKFYTLGVEGVAKSWDATTCREDLIFDLPETEETVCLTVSPQGDLIAVGSKNLVSLVDMRSGSLIDTIVSQDRDMGVRSLSWRHSFVGIGGGQGSMAFYDTRKSGFLMFDNTQNFFKTGIGWLDEDDRFGDLEPCHAVMTHCFDPSGTRLFVGGGPVSSGRKGAYAAIW